MEHGLSRTLQSCAMRRSHHTHQREALSLRCSEAVDCCSVNYYLLHYRSAQQLIVQGRLWKEICPVASWLTTLFLFHGFLVQAAT